MSTSAHTSFGASWIAKSVKTIFLLLCASTWLLPTAGADTTVLVSGLTGPVKLDLTPRGNLLVTERGTALNRVNDGRLSRVDRYGNVQPLLSGLPSGIETTGTPSGPQSVVVRGSFLVDLTIGEGHSLVFGPNGPPTQVPNPVGANSPIFSSVLRLIFNRSIDRVSDGFALTDADHVKLADGFTVVLENASGDKLWVRLVVDLKDFRPDQVTNVRGSNPFAMIEGKHFDGLLLVDSGQNSVVQVDPFQWPKTLLRFPPIVNPAGVIPPVSDAVPTSIRHYVGSKYLVSLLTGVPFRAGAASIRLVDIRSRTQSVLISGLTTVTDVLAIGSDIYVLEISSNLSQGAPGRLLRFSSPAAPPVVVATGLIGGSGMTYSPSEQAIYIAEIFAGRITRVGL